MTVIVLNVRPDCERLCIDESYDSIVQMIEAPVRYLRVHAGGKKITVQKSFILKIEDEEESY